MAGTQGRTREQLRKSIGRNLIGHRLIVSAATSDGDETGLVDDTLFGGDDNYNGWWMVVKGGVVRRVSDYDSAGSRLSWTRPLSEATTIGHSYELWPSEYPPEVIHDYINQTIGEAAGHIYEPVEDESLQAGGSRARFAIPAGIDAIWKVQVRVSASSPSPVDADAVVWRTLPRHLWGIDKGERVLTLTDGGRRLAGSGSPQARWRQGADAAVDRRIYDRRAGRVRYRAGRRRWPCSHRRTCRSPAERRARSGTPGHGKLVPRSPC